MRIDLILALLLCGAWSQDPPRDPFAPSDLLKEAERKREATTPLPPILLRGFIQIKGGAALALLEVDGRDTLLVRPGESLVLSGRTVLIEEVKDGGVTLKLEPNGESLRIR